MIPATGSRGILQELAGNHRKKSGNFLAGIPLPQNHWNYSEPAVSGRDCSTWEPLYQLHHNDQM
jgi:hypothetical protein